MTHIQRFEKVLANLINISLWNLDSENPKTRFSDVTTSTTTNYKEDTIVTLTELQLPTLLKN